ncbi:MAG: 4Fe-4S dicluster domain-containing protein [Proteobacteria bacterium]|nr:4Fe-4S dicluster domain-containing protein [Pseudomonadota bacterium]MBU1708689.1 4Fe-4S dicluster domain-containing protein [Pseudomonadota bacterium]
MLFKIFSKKELPILFEVLSVNPIIGPVQIASDRKGQPIYSFDIVYDFNELRLDYTTTKYSAKKYFLPYLETLCSFNVSPESWEKKVDFNIYKPFVFFGMHACDINALNKLDKVLMESVYPTPYYASKRKNMFIIGMDCAPQPFCFCRSMGTDTVFNGFDMYLTDIGDSFFAEIVSAEAFNYLKSITTREPTGKDHALYLETVKAREKSFTAKVDTTDLTKILDMEFHSDVWKTWGEKCLSCGTCANVCPTCYCYGVEEQVDMDLKGAVKLKHLHSCNLIDFAEVAGGHNFRPESHTRLKYRYYHKHRGFVEAFEESLCVGCGRCGEACLADITVPEVISSVRGEEA